MKLTTQSQRAIMAMMALALHTGRKVLRLSTLAKEQGISLSYMEQLFYHLRHAGLVEGIRGPGGGYRLGRPSSHISVAEIVAAIEAATEDDEQDRKTHPTEEVGNILNALDEQVHDFLDGISLESLVGDHKQPDISYRPGKMARAIAGMFPALPTTSVPQPAM
uniref:Iron-sulfur cluster regulator IscR n=1 Tax=uncultured Thiotrichaceae bacterium TaxID=298394 RepID=A0A6S6T724_9GAMM|nr:MAG: Iron-sulfur cluster regulator IscR [uncultured Thiotrichaceae bacterium]